MVLASKKIALGAIVFLLAACGQSGGVSPNGSTSTTTPSASPKRIFISATTSNGSFGTATAADAICAADANKPTGGTYKAMVVSSARIACTTANCSGGISEHTDWVLRPSTVYQRADGTAIGTTGANGVFTFPLTNSFGGATVAWVGLSSNWTSSNTCSDWSSGLFGVNGNYAITNMTSSSVFANTGGCNSSSSFICVEQ